MSEPISSGGVVSAAFTKASQWVVSAVAGLAPVLGAVSAQWFGAITGAILGFLTYRMVRYFSIRREQREQALFDAQMAALKEKA